MRPRRDRSARSGYRPRGWSRKPAFRSPSTPPALPPDTTSNIAGGQFHRVRRRSSANGICGHSAEFMTSARMLALDSTIWRRFQIILADRSRRGRCMSGPYDFHADSPMLTRAEHPFPLDRAPLRHDVRRDRPLRQMARRADRRRQDRGSPVARHRRHRGASEAWCSTAPGSAAATCSATQELHPVRGQLAILEPQPEVRYAHRRFATCSRAPTASLLGGTFEVDLGPTPQPDDRAHPRVHKRFFAGFRCTA